MGFIQWYVTYIYNINEAPLRRFGLGQAKERELKYSLSLIRILMLCWMVGSCLLDAGILIVLEVVKVLD